MGCHFLLQGIFPTQGLNPGLLHGRQMLYPLSHQGSPSISLSPFFGGRGRQEYCSGLPFPSPGDLPDPGIKPASLMSPVFAGEFFTTDPLVAQSEESACNAGDLGSIPGSGRSPGGGNGYPLQYSCLENSMNRGAWWAAVHGVTKSRTRLSD